MRVVEAVWKCGLILMVAGLIGLAGCTTSHCTPINFSLSLTRDSGGKATPIAAAQAFALGPRQPGLPTSGWHQVNRDTQGATVVSGTAHIHAVEGTDGSWQVDSGGSVCPA
jgi:hypothetical protein